MRGDEPLGVAFHWCESVESKVHERCRTIFLRVESDQGVRVGFVPGVRRTGRDSWDAGGWKEARGCGELRRGVCEGWRRSILFQKVGMVGWINE